MKFNILNKMFIEDILGTESKIKIIRTLLEINTAFTIRDLEKETGLSRGIIHRELKRLEQINIIYKVEKKGKLEFYKINTRNSYVKPLIEIFELEKVRERYNKIPVITWNMLSSLVNKILSNRIEVEEITLFGSVARGTATINSDIDLLVLTKEEFKDKDKLNDIIKEIQKKTKRKINITIMSKNMFEKGGTAIVDEIRKEEILLFTKDSKRIERNDKYISHWAYY